MGRIGMGRSERRQQVWEFVRSYMKASAGRPPTVREIKEGARLRSVRHVQQSLTELEHAGLLFQDGFGRARSIGIVGARYILPEEGPAASSIRGII